jgi:hypothetical protein
MQALASAAESTCGDTGSVVVPPATPSSLAESTLAPTVARPAEFHHSAPSSTAASSAAGDQIVTSTDADARRTLHLLAGSPVDGLHALRVAYIDAFKAVGPSCVLQKQFQSDHTILFQIAASDHKEETEERTRRYIQQAIAVIHSWLQWFVATQHSIAPPAAAAAAAASSASAATPTTMLEWIELLEKNERIVEPLGTHACVSVAGWLALRSSRRWYSHPLWLSPARSLSSLLLQRLTSAAQTTAIECMES